MNYSHHQPLFPVVDPLSHTTQHQESVDNLCHAPHLTSSLLFFLELPHALSLGVRDLRSSIEFVYMEF